MSTELTIIKQEDLQSAGTVLATTKTWVAAYKKKHDALLILAKKDGEKLTAETDQAINDYLASLKKAAAKAEADRKPYTSKFDEVVKIFTAEEKILKIDLFTELQNARNVSVAAYKKEEAIENAKAQAKLDKAKAEIELFAEAETQIRTQYATLLRRDKEKLMEVYENCSLEMYDSALEMLDMVVGTFKQEYWDGIVANLAHNELDNTRYFTVEELAEICEKAKDGKFEKVAPHYQSEIQSYAQHLVTLMPDRKLELEAGITESASAANIKTEQEALELKQTQDAANRTEQLVQTQVSSVIIDTQINAANRLSKVPDAKSIDSYEIIVLERAGWSEIFKFYITHSDEQDLGKIKLDSMKLFAERKAKSEGLKIESAYIKYEEKYKAVVKSKRAA